MLPSLVLRQTLSLAGRQGRVNLTSILGRRPDVVDPLFAELFDSVGSHYKTKNLFYEAQTINKIDSVMNLPLIDYHEEANNLCAVMSILLGSGLLDVSKAAHETEVIFGRTIFKRIEFVLLIEHELKRGSDQIHCHARFLSEWKNDNSTLLRRRTG